MKSTLEPILFFYGKLAGASRREAGRLARGAGYRVAETLNSGVDLVVLGEGEPLQETRTSLARVFDERSTLAFERGTLRIITETDFLSEISSPTSGVSGLGPLSAVQGASTSTRPITDGRGRKGSTPAAVASIVGASVGTIRRWLRRGLLKPIDASARLPLLSDREILVARRLALLCSGELSEETVEKRIRAFAVEEASRRRATRVAAQVDLLTPSPPTDKKSSSPRHDDEFPLFSSDRLFADPPEQSSSVDRTLDPTLQTHDESETIALGDIVLTLTLSADGRDLLQYRRLDDADSPDARLEPTDARGQRFFSFAAFPADGAIDVPANVKLSPEEEQIALAERLSEWNAKSSNEFGVPAFLALFPGDESSDNVEVDTEAAPAAPLSSTLSTTHDSDAKGRGEESTEPEWNWLEKSSRILTTDQMAAEKASREEEQQASKGLEVTSTRYKLADVGAVPSTSSEGASFYGAARARWQAAASIRQAVLCEEAWTLEHEGYWEESARAYRLAALAGGADAGVNLRLGRVLQLLGDFGGARERFHAALELDPDLSEARVELGRAYAADGNLADAYDAFRAALEYRPADPLLRVELGKLYLHRGDRRAAEEEFRIAANRVDDPQLANDVRRLLVTLEKSYKP